MEDIMLAFISFLLVCIGAFNWFTIGILQYDFVAGLFGSQANIFSRLVYTLVGVASIIVIFNLIKNKGKFVISFKKANKEYEEMKKEKEEKKEEQIQEKGLANSMEASKDFYAEKEAGNRLDDKYYTHKKDEQKLDDE